MKSLLLILTTAVATWLVLATRQPAEFRVSRSIVISAPKANVFPLVNDLHAWHAWSPWAKLDPHGKETFEGPAAGKGAVMKWSGNYKVGQGAMTITESRPSDLIRFRLDFQKPLPATHTAEFTFNVQGTGTKVTWSMFGNNNFVGKAIGLVMSCDQMVGGQFEKGLASLKSMAEAIKEPAPPVKIPAVKIKK